MIFNILPDVCIEQIFIYLNDYIHLRMLESSHSFFTTGYSKDFISNYLSKRKNFIRNYFPSVIIEMLGGYNQILHYPILENPRIRNKRILFTGNYHIAIIPSPTFEQMKYSIMIGVTNHQPFISLVIEIIHPLYPSVPSKKEKTVLTIYAEQPAFLFTRSGLTPAYTQWKTNNNFISHSFCEEIAGYTNGHFHILDFDFYKKIIHLVYHKSKYENLHNRPKYKTYSEMHIENTPLYNKPLIINNNQ